MSSHASCRRTCPREENMKTYRVLPILATAALIIGLVPAAAVARAGSVASPSLVRGPQAVPANVAGPNSSLFSCQVGLSVGVCYDPYQMRHAYGIDTLINAGFTGKGKTIIIVDSFQSPNIVAQLNYFDTFYGLPGMNGLGNASDPKLGKFTQIAPGANIVLDLAKSDQDPDILSATKYAVRHNLGDVISQSFGENESCVDPALLAEQHQVFAEATKKGITLFA